MANFLFAELTAQECELINGGNVADPSPNAAAGDNGTADAVNTTGTAGFVNDWHGLGYDHIHDGTDGDPANLHGDNGVLPNGKTLSPAG